MAQKYEIVSFVLLKEYGKNNILVTEEQKRKRVRKNGLVEKTIQKEEEEEEPQMQIPRSTSPAPQTREEAEERLTWKANPYKGEWRCYGVVDVWENARRGTFIHCFKSI